MPNIDEAYAMWRDQFAASLSEEDEAKILLSLPELHERDPKMAVLAARLISVLVEIRDYAQSKRG